MSSEPPFDVLGYYCTDLRVRFGETDRFGYMWHGWVLAYFERARADIARFCRLTPSDLLEFDLTVPMVDVDVRYTHVAYDDEELIVQATLLRHRLRMPFLDFYYRIVQKDGGKEVARGRTRQVLLKQNGRLITRVPAEVSSRLATLYSHLEAQPRWPDDYIEELLERRR
ncbi:acyl-CoA thioesterase [Paraliomyxa miuraensis]|uniref:acyl-CoA thioesterase n=1 Tax=Paraliomyxa miuraensis TaxID=376150 RepID=UPI00224DC9CB|nr:acyl-CoA thioesterase [Paraliomyxa miuraensis]MCX4243002.1 acyl-CoA thioesterase [Paraliomyxa miuraensis]